MTIPDSSSVEAKTKVGEESGLLALAIRSAILGGISSPILVEEYWLGLLFQAGVGVFLAMVLYGLEVVIFRRRKSTTSTPFAVAATRAAVLLLIMSYLRFADIPRALGSLLSGFIYGAIVFAIEVGARKLFRKVLSKHA